MPYKKIKRGRLNLVVVPYRPQHHVESERLADFIFKTWQQWVLPFRCAVAALGKK